MQAGAAAGNEAVAGARAASEAAPVSAPSSLTAHVLHRRMHVCGIFG